MLDYFFDLIARLGHWGYLVIFLGAMLESAAFLGLLVPGESLVLVSGFLAAQGLLDLDVLIVAVALGAALGDSIGYEMGRWLGRPALLRYGGRVGLTAARVQRADAFFVRHGSKAIFLGRFVGFARALVPFLAGSAKMPYRRFLPFNLLGAALWSVLMVLLGYFLGASWHTAEHWIGRASAILGGILLFFLLLAWGYRWAVRHEADIKRERARFPRRPGIAAMRTRFAPHIAFLHARLSPRGYLGLRLIAGALVLIGASWIFGGIAEDVVTGDPITLVDVRVAHWFEAHAMPFLTRCMLVLTHLHDPAGISILTGLAALILISRRDWYWLTCLLVAVPSGAVLNMLMKYAFHRPRPSLEHPILVLTSYSFPSGHAVSATLFYGVLAAMLISKAGAWRTRVIIALVALALVVLVALSRLYLGVHFLSDVLGGFAEAIAWLALCLSGIHTYWQYRVVDQAVRSGA